VLNDRIGQRLPCREVPVQGRAADAGGVGDLLEGGAEVVGERLRDCG
jgi:hypothetical protein